MVLAQSSEIRVALIILKFGTEDSGVLARHGTELKVGKRFQDLVDFQFLRIMYEKDQWRNVT